MSLFDFFFPEEAQAMHLRSLAENNAFEARRAMRERVREHRERTRAKIMEGGNAQRIEKLEAELGEAMLVIEALLELLEEKGTIEREKLAERAKEIDGRDGMVDGALTIEELRKLKPKKGFVPKRSWPGEGEGDGEE